MYSAKRYSAKCYSAKRLSAKRISTKRGTIELNYLNINVLTTANINSIKKEEYKRIFIFGNTDILPTVCLVYCVTQL